MRELVGGGDIASIHDVEAAGLEGDLVENVYVVEFAVGDMDEGRNVAPQIEQRVEFDRPLVFAKARPGKKRQAHIDGSRVERIDRTAGIRHRPICIALSDYQAEDLKQPYDDNNDDNDIQDVLDLSVHGYVGIDEPKQHANHN